MALEDLIFDWIKKQIYTEDELVWTMIMFSIDCPFGVYVTEEEAKEIERRLNKLLI